MAKATGYFDPAYFPNVQGGNDPFSRAGLMRAVADLTSDTVVAQLNAGNRLSSFPVRYGAGRTIKTFSPLPGEKTRIKVSTYRRSETSSRQATSILDSNSEEAESDFERSVLAEQSSQDSTSKSLEYPRAAGDPGQGTTNNWQVKQLRSAASAASARRSRW